jgi:hypothetical protein
MAAVYPCRWWTLPEERKQLLQCGAIAFGKDLYAAVGAIAHVSPYAQSAGVLEGKVAESNALHPSLDLDPYARLHGKLDRLAMHGKGRTTAPLRCGCSLSSC